jgi:hypothetical protein
MSTITRKTGMSGQRGQLRATADGRPRKASAPSTSPDAMTAERIRTRAYEIYQKRNGNGSSGDATSDWLEAERELNGAAAEPSAAAEIEIRADARGQALLASDE